MRSLFYRVLSAKELNSQLQNPSLRKDGSVQATILMFYMYRVCNISVDAYETLFGGIKMFRAIESTMSEESAWLTTTFN